MKPLYTRWGRALDFDHVLEEYPRPLLRRSSYCSLNGFWNHCISDKDAMPDTWDGPILVPFSPECLLSGVDRQLLPDQYLWYERPLPAFYSGKGRLILHFGAVDQNCQVFINGTNVGSHSGGYLPFSFDITEAVSNISASDPILLQIKVQDPSDSSYHSRGKQKLRRGGMYYTAQSGIWQTVWMEEVPNHYIHGLNAAADADSGTVTICADADEKFPVKITVYAPAKADSDEEMPSAGAEIAAAEGFTGENITLSLDLLRLWDCDNPWLYTYTVAALSDSAEDTADRVESYFALRTFSIENDEKGIPRICLNHQPQFQRGVLDQGYWSDGLYTAPSDDALIFDILSMKKMGYNMIRKHIKIEPQRWYYHCDRLGMVVWQDMVNGGSSYADWYVTYAATAFSVLNIKPKDRYRRLLSRQDEKGKEEFIQETTASIQLLKHHPSIAVWVIFNEGWGQFDTEKITELVRKTDPTRLIDSASGWFDQGCGDFNSFHNYFFPMKLQAESRRASVLSEFGGYSMAIPGHIISDELYGYGTYKDFPSLQAAFEKREAEVNALIPAGLCASVYTQVSDIEDEVNGIFTYDRETQKLH